MSTSNIKEALLRLRTMRLEQIRRYSDDGRTLADAAEKELTALRKALAIVVREKALEDWYTSQPVELREAIQLLQSVARSDT